MGYVIQTESLIIDKVIPPINVFGKMDGVTQTLTHCFKLDGSVIVADENGDAIEILTPPKVGDLLFESIELFYDEESKFVKYIFKVDEQHQVVETFDFNSKIDRVKITIAGTIPESSKISLPIATASNLQISKMRIASNSVGFDWADINDNSFGCNSATWNKKTETLDIYVDTVFEIDPSTVVTISNSGIITSTTNRKVYQNQGLYWVFYIGSTGYICWKTSANGITWSNESISTCKPSGNYSVAFATCLVGNVITVVYNVTSLNDGYYYGSKFIYHNFGTLNYDGSIAWNGTRTIVYTASTDGYSYSNMVGALDVCRDSAGHTIVAFEKNYYEVDPETYEVIGNSFSILAVTGSATNGSIGTMTTHTVESDGTLAYDYIFPSVHSLSSGKTVVLYTSSKLNARRWDGGTTWATITFLNSSTTPNKSFYGTYSAVSYENEVYITFEENYTGYGNKLWFGVYNSTTNAWTNTVNIASVNVSSQASTISVDPTNGNIYIFYMAMTNASTCTNIYVMVRSGTTWGTPTNIVTGTENLLYWTDFTSQEFATNGKLGLIYLNSNKTSLYFYEYLLFPTQYGGFKHRTAAGTEELCKVDRLSGNPNIAYKCRICDAVGQIRDVYLVETTDPNASGWHINTPQGVKAVRKKT